MTRSRASDDIPAEAKALSRLAVASGRQLRQCMEMTSAAVGIAFPREYFARGTVYALLDRSDEVLGSAIVVDVPPFRSLLSIPHRVDWPSTLGCDYSQLAEINGLWMAANAPLLAMYKFWIEFLENLLAAGHQQFLFTFANDNQKMSALCQLAKPKILYCGLTKVLPGMKEQASETIAMISATALAELLNTIRGDGSMERAA